MVDALLAWDAASVQWLAHHRVIGIDWVMLAFTTIGYVAGVWLLAALVLGVRGVISRQSAFQLVLAVTAAWIVAELLFKPVFARERPFLASETIVAIGLLPASLSFPSGHAATSFAGAAILSRAWPRGRIVAWGVAGLIALSRVYTGVHYPSDVLVGAFVGLTCAAAVGALWPLVDR